MVRAWMMARIAIRIRIRRESKGVEQDEGGVLGGVASTVQEWK